MRLALLLVLTMLPIRGLANPPGGDPDPPAPGDTPPVDDKKVDDKKVEDKKVEPPTTPVAPAKPVYDMKLRELEERVVGLKEKVFKSKTRLLLLREQILHNIIAEARAVLVHKNDMSSSFTLEQVLYSLDNDKIYFKDNKDGSLDKSREFEIFNGNVLPGNHALTVELVYRGNGSLFSYIDGYRFKIRSTYTFYAAKGRITRIKIIGYEKGGMTTDLEQKPYLRYDVRQFRYSRENLKKRDGGGEDDR